ncbi:hypothetical protein DLJ46_22635 [Micromonospora globispora]|uniref:SnoaL-like domain-containing protein n=1 Tax=Micromonospora globispora TaxID=1450148 RepID=A0A317JWE1_9ACTN|nr:nuclear transport factor 2 family protein [Micromonospora globispora]PWU45087.1 hypothetical protein DLJ46_22635 [Micromonospora globispora]
MDEQAVRVALRQYLEHAGKDDDVAHEIHREDAVLEFPQSGERFEGVANFREWRRAYPAKVTFELRRVRGRDDIWVAELLLRYDGGPPHHAVDILEFRGDKVAYETIYVTEGWAAPEWRARWRAAPPREPSAGSAPAA